MIAELVVKGKDGKYLTFKPNCDSDFGTVEHIYHHISHWNGDKEVCSIYYMDSDRIDTFFNIVSISYGSEAGDDVNN